MTRRRDTVETLERRLASWRAVRPDDRDYGLLSLKVIPELEQGIANLKAQVDQSPEGQDPAEGLGRNDESAVADGDAPKPCSPSDNLSGDGW